MIQVGGSAVLGLSLPALLRAEARSGPRPTADACVLIFLNGGPSHLDMWDMNHEHFARKLDELGEMLKEFANTAPVRAKEARAVLKTVPGVGPVTIEVVLSELGDITRFRNAKTVCADAGLAPIVRQSSGVRRPRTWASARRAQGSCDGS
jgi:transposase